MARQTIRMAMLLASALASLVGVKSADTLGSGAGAEDVSLGFREIGGTNVPAGAVQMMTGSLRLSPEAAFLKTGGGTLEIPVSHIDTAAPYSIDVLGGKLKLTGGADSSAAADALDVAPDSLVITFR